MIKTSVVSKVFVEAGNAILKAGGADKRTTATELDEALSSSERDVFTKQFYQFARERSGNSSDALSERDLKAAVAFARKMLGDADKSKNGLLSKPEIAKMTALGRLAVLIAKDVEKGKASAKLEEKFSKAAEGVQYISDSNFPPKFVSGSFSGRHVTANAIRQALDSTLLSFLNERRIPEEHLTSETIAYDVFPRPRRDAFLDRLVKSSDPGDLALVTYAKGFKKILTLANKELDDIRVVRVGPKGVDGRIPVSPGLCVYLIVGKAKTTGFLSGVMFGSVDT